MSFHGPVLIVDDDADIRTGIGQLIELSGHPTALAQDGAEAMRYLRRGLSPCLILLDLEMPRSDGISFRREQLADPALAPIPVILHSSRSDAAQLAAQLRFAAHVPKPADVDTLLQLVAQHCDRRDA